MENRLAEIITDIIFQHTSCDYHKDGGFFTCEIYADYRDYAENSTVIKWCEADNPHEAFNEELFCWYQDCIFECEDDVIDTVKRHWTDAEFSFDDNESLLLIGFVIMLPSKSPWTIIFSKKYAWISLWIPAMEIMILFPMICFRITTQDLEM